jgi:hypothetical protein
METGIETGIETEEQPAATEETNRQKIARLYLIEPIHSFLRVIPPYIKGAVRSQGRFLPGGNTFRVTCVSLERKTKGQTGGKRR